MRKHEADKLIETIRGFVNEHEKLSEALDKVQKKASELTPLKDIAVSVGLAVNANGDGLQQFTDLNTEKLYLAFKNRLIDEAQVDPVLLHLLTTRPEIVVEVERKLVNLDGSELKGRVARLMASGWFGTARKGGTVRTELTRTGADPGGGGALYNVLNAYVKDGFLLREGDGYIIAPGVKVTEQAVSNASA